VRVDIRGRIDVLPGSDHSPTYRENINPVTEAPIEGFCRNPYSGRNAIYFPVCAGCRATFGPRARTSVSSSLYLVASTNVVLGPRRWSDLTGLRRPAEIKFTSRSCGSEL
jgi:hypothetical protein